MRTNCIAQFGYQPKDETTEMPAPPTSGSTIEWSCRRHERLKTLFAIKEEDVSDGEFHCEIIGNRGWTSKEDAVVEFKKLVADQKSIDWIWADGRKIIDHDTETLFEFHEEGNYKECHYSLSIVELKV